MANHTIADNKMPDNGIYLISKRETIVVSTVRQIPRFCVFLSSLTWFLVLKSAIWSWADGIVGDDTIENPVSDSRMSLYFHLSSRLGS